MKPVRTFSPIIYRGLLAFGAIVFVGLVIIAWTSDTPEVGLDWKFKLQLTAAGVILGGGPMSYAFKYKRDAEQEEREAEMVRRNLGTR